MCSLIDKSMTFYQEKLFTLLQNLNKVSHCLISMGRGLKTFTPMMKKEDLAISILIFGTMSKTPWFLVLAQCLL